MTGEAFIPGSALLVATLLAPLGFALGFACPAGRRILAGLLPASLLPAFLTAVFVPDGTERLFPSLLFGLHLGIDASSRPFLAFTALLWFASAIFAAGDKASDPRRGRFFFLFALSLAGNLGLILARDMVGFYTAFALMSFAAYGLVIHPRTETALAAGRVYLCFVVLGELGLFSGMVLLADAAGSLEFTATAAAAPPRAAVFLLLVGLGVKAGALPVHLWLPPAHSAAPTPASAVLSGAMIKAGLLGWLRFLPPGPLGGDALGGVFLLGGAAAAFYAAAVGCTQRQPKTVLAYSSVSQMGLIAIALGTCYGEAGAAEEGIRLVGLYAAHHGMAKAALFLGVGILAGLPAGGNTRRLALAGLLLPALALAGAPGTSGFFLKNLLDARLAALPPEWGGIFSFLLPLSSFATTLLLCRFLWLVRSHPFGGNTTWPMALSWMLLLAAVAGWLYGLPAVAAAEAGDWLSALWPIVAGGLVAAGAVVARMQGRASPLPEVPPGDLLAAGIWAATRGEALLRRLRRSLAAGEAKARALPAWMGRGFLPIQALEASLFGGPSAGVGFLLLLIALAAAFLGWV